MPQINNTNVRFPFVTRVAAFALGTAWPWAASRLFERVFLTPRRLKRGTASGLLGADAISLPIPTGKLRCWTSGSGPTVLLVHGWNGAAGNWQDAGEALVRAGFRIVAFDAPAHGDAPRRTTNVIEWKQSVCYVAAEFGRLYGMVGHSLGSLASVLAMREGVNVDRLALISPPADLAVVTRELGRLFGFPDRIALDCLQRLSERLDVDWESIQTTRLVTRFDRPLFVVHDREDREIRWEDGRAIADAAPVSELMTTTGLGHRRILKDPAVVSAVTNFMLAHSPASPHLAEERSKGRADPPSS